jgi:hypothetical protein
MGYLFLSSNVMIITSYVETTLNQSRPVVKTHNLHKDQIKTLCSNPLEIYKIISSKGNYLVRQLSSLPTCKYSNIGVAFYN